MKIFKESVENKYARNFKEEFRKKAYLNEDVEITRELVSNPRYKNTVVSLANSYGTYYENMVDRICRDERN